MIDLNCYAIKNTLKILLKDQTTKTNILWATNSYTQHQEQEEITIQALRNMNGKLQSRCEKNKEIQKARTKIKAEVYTPSWMCCRMNNNLDELFFERKSVFNEIKENSWKNKRGKIGFRKKSWKEYVKLNILEITCGEAPFLVSRYDTTNGKYITPPQRIGLLDRKLRAINENTKTFEEWFEWVCIAYKCVYGYEWQGDNLLIARINLLMTFYEYYLNKWGEEPSIKELKEIATIISWNIWQMDGLHYNVPYKNKYCVIRKNCEKHTRKIYFKDLVKGDLKSMKDKKLFDFCIGNPPYQEEMINTSDKPIYHLFINEAYKIANVVETISPGRFLFNAGKTPKKWNDKMLNDKHIKVVMYEQNSSKIFPTTDIKGGVVVILKKDKEKYEPIKIFTTFNELNSIIQKVKILKEQSLMNLIYPDSSYTISKILQENNELVKSKITSGGSNLLTTNIFDIFPDIFDDMPKLENETYIKILGRQNNERIYKFILMKYVICPENINAYKVFLPKSNGSGALGEVLSTPLVEQPLVGHTQSFISIGNFDNEIEAINLLKYIKTKFCRCMLGVLKITQHNGRDTWKYVPIQDFTNNSEIDWSQSIPNIDKQLYKKYNLTEEEITFIEEKIKEME